MLNSPKTHKQAYAWLLVGALAGLLMAFLFDDSCQQDGGQHFLFARWAWTHPELFVGVWSRPLFTTLYAFPALLSFRAARLLTVLICVLISWQTWRLATELKLPRAPFSIPLLWLQPSFLLFSADTMTEPIFALCYVIALRLHHQGRVKAGLLVASLLILARPEGFFLAALWAVWVLPANIRQNPFSVIHQPRWLLLGAGFALWWLAALLLTGDPLFIKHNWPTNWPMTGTIYGAAGLLAFPARLPEITGLFLLPVFLYGLVWLLKQRSLCTLTSSFLLLFGLHTILRAFGLLGSAGYPRYLVTIAPAVALLTLVGWHQLAQRLADLSLQFRRAAVALLLLLSAYVNFVYADGAEWSRDARALTVAHQWWQAQPQAPQITKLLWCQPYACILFDHDPWENPAFTRDKARDLEMLRAQPAGTLAVWDEKVGPKWFGLSARDFASAGFVSVHAQSFSLRGYILDRSWFGFGGPRQQTIHLLYKSQP